MHFVQILLAAVLAALINAAAPVLRPYVVGAATSTARRLSPFWRGFLVGAAAALIVAGGFASLGGLPSIAWPDWSFPSIVTPAGPRQVVIVHETSDDTPALADLWRQAQASAELAQHKVLIVDDDQPTEPLRPYLELAKKHTLPALVITDAGGKVLFEGPCPQSLTELVSRVKKHGG